MTETGEDLGHGMNDILMRHKAQCVARLQAWIGSTALTNVGNTNTAIPSLAHGSTSLSFVTDERRVKMMIIRLTLQPDHVKENWFVRLIWATASPAIMP